MYRYGKVINRNNLQYIQCGEREDVWGTVLRSVLITINVPVVYMAWGVMILMWANHLGLLWVQMVLASLVAMSGPKRVSIFRALPFQ